MNVMMNLIRPLLAAAGLLAVGCAATGGRTTDTPRHPEKFTLAEGSEYQPLLKGAPQTCGMRAGLVVLCDGRSNEVHSTGEHEESLVFLAGSGQVEFEGHPPIPARAGDVVYIPPRTTHCVRAATGAELRYVYIVAPIPR